MKKLFFALLLFFSAACLAQSTVPLVGLPVDHGPALPTTCNIGQIYFQTASGGGGIGLYACTATNTWTGPFGASGGGGNANYTGTQNVLAKGSGTAHTLIDSSITDNGTTIAATESISTTGGVTTGVGGTTAGFYDFINGTAHTPTANSFSMFAPATITTAFGWSMPAAENGSAGVLHLAAASSHVSAATVSAVALADVATQVHDTEVANVTSGTAAPTAAPLPAGGTNGCSGATDIPTYTAGTGWGCTQRGSGPATTLPSLGSLTQINFTGASATATQNTTNGPIMIYEPNHAGVNWALLTQAQPTIPYGFVANIRCGEYQQASYNTATCGVYFEDNISGKIEGFELENNSGSTIPRVEHITNPTTDGGTIFSVPPGTAQLFGSWNAYAASTWIRLRNNGTTLYFDVSVDGSNFVNMYSEAVGSFITPTSIGYGGILVNGATNWQQISILSWTLINNANP